MEISMDHTDSLKQFILNEILMDHIQNSLSSSDLLIEKGLIDSIGIMKLITFMEENYSIEIDEEDLIPENFETISALSAFVVRKRNSLT
jgi:acyl carrier protein